VLFSDKKTKNKKTWVFGLGLSPDPNPKTQKNKTPNSNPFKGYIPYTRYTISIKFKSNIEI
jgi:hypothetical protein